jgi:phosphoribosylanthranilate isomerase
MPAPEIKICGINTPEALEAAITARADYIGLNFFPPSPRCVTPACAAALTAQAAGRIASVGVFVDPDDAQLAAVLTAVPLDAVQLHGAEAPERVAQVRARFGKPVWKAVAIAAPSDIDKAADHVGAADFLLFDAKTPKGMLPGGMGLTFDWSLLAAWKNRAPWGLAGGLDAGNVAHAAAITGAPLVDVSSGVESAPGVKDLARIAAFCAAARGA